MLRIETSGDPFKRGRQQGMVCRDLFIPWANHQLHEMAQHIAVSSTDDVIRGLEKKVSFYRQQTKGVYPEGFEVCCGIASGLEMDEDTYFTALFSYRLLWNFQQCTTLGFHNQDGQTILGKTDDISQHELGMNVLETVFHHTRHRYIDFHFAGTIWTSAGMNEYGLAIAMTGIPGPALEKDGVESFVALHNILPACTTVAEAIECVRSLKINFYGFSLLIGDANGGLLLVEKTGTAMAILPQQDRKYFLHTNHALDTRCIARTPTQMEPILTNGKRRYANALKLTHSLSHSEEGMQMFLSDNNPHGAIWQQGEDGFYTDFGVIFVPSEKRIVFWPGYPGGVEASTLELGKVFS